MDDTTSTTIRTVQLSVVTLLVPNSTIINRINYKFNKLYMIGIMHHWHYEHCTINAMEQ